MSPELFRQTLDARSAPRTNRLSALPVSIFVHVMVVLALVVIPLLATDVLPAVRDALPDWMPTVAAPAPPPAAPAVHQPAHEVAMENPDAAPLDAPQGVHEPDGLERSVAALDAPGASGVVDGGIQGGKGLVVDAPPPPPPVPAEPVHAGGMIREPRKIVDVRPEYPDAARAARVEGMVIIEAVIGPTGDVREARVLRSRPLLDDAALAAVRQWKFTPTLLNGVPVPIVITVTVNFVLQR